MKVVEPKQPERKVFTNVGTNGEVNSVVELIILPDIFGKKPSGYIHKVYTEPTKQNEGIASKLVQMALAYARDQNCYKVFLVCHAENQQIYSGMDFKRSQIEMEYPMW